MDDNLRHRVHEAVAVRNGDKHAEAYPEDMRGDADERDHRKPRDLRCSCGSGVVAEYCLPCKEERANRIKTYTLGQLLDTFPTMREPVIDGLLRVGETLNLIAAPKTGKSWTAGGLAFSVATGHPWLGFTVTQGDVLLIDNELHCETLASRLHRVAEAHGINVAEVRERITILPLRGRLRDLHALDAFLRGQKPGRFKLVILDAFYRSIPINTDENSNAAIAGLYNVIDAYTDHLGGAWCNIHHASKGSQAAKSITDVGSGAGSQSRAADSHVILRPHVEDGVIVFDGVVRSFPPLSPRCLRWCFPAFVPAEDLDPADLQETAPRRRRKQEDGTPPAPPEPPWDAKRFANAFGSATPKKRVAIIEEAVATGLSERRAEHLLKAAIERDYLFAQRCDGWGASFVISNVPFPAEKPRKRRS